MTSSGISPEPEAAIILACQEHESQNKWKNDYRRCIVFRNVFIKFDSYKSMLPQYKTQKYISELAATNPNAPHIPEVYSFFTPDFTMAYLVMERIEFTPTSVQDLSQRAAQSLRWLHGLIVPDGATIGSLGGGRARHKLFKNYEAPLNFSSTVALENYLEKARLDTGNPELAPIHICHESLVFTQSDMDMSNFGVDMNGKTCLFDFEAVGILPLSFVAYTLSRGNGTFVSKVAEHLNLLPSPNTHTMARIHGHLWMLADPKLGLDGDGMPM